MANDYVRQVADTLIRQLERGTAPWQKPWEPGERFMPYNPVTGKGYHGINALYLMATMDGRGVVDPRWMTFKQAQSVDAYVRKGEKSTPIQFWKWHDTVPVLDEAGKPKRDENGQPMRATVLLEKPRVFSASVFNASQIEGLPPQDRAAPPEWDRHQRAEAIIAHSGAAIQHTAGNRAFYTLRHDSITMPERNQFPTADRYYATLLHEMGHWTGHESRLNRDLERYPTQLKRHRLLGMDAADPNWDRDTILRK